MKWQQSIFRKMPIPEMLLLPMVQLLGLRVLTKKSNLYRSHQQERTLYQPCTVNRRTVPLQPIGAKQKTVGFIPQVQLNRRYSLKTASKPVYTKPKR